MRERVPFNKDMWLDLWPGLVITPDSQMSPRVLQRVRDFDIKAATDQELYDFLVSISHEPITEVSSFIVELFAVDKHYKLTT